MDQAFHISSVATHLFRARRARLVWAALGIIVCCTARAADPQPYRVSVEANGDRALDNALRAGSELESLRKSAPASPFALILRARQDVERLGAILEGFGFYAAQVQITINGQPLDDPELADTLTALPDGTDANVRVAVQTGTLYTLRSVDVEGALPESLHDTLNLAPGAPAVAADILTARQRLLTALQQQGYAFAQIDVPVADVDAEQPVIDLHVAVRAGVPVTIGEIRFSGLQRMNEAVVRSRVPLRRGDRYDPRKIDDARRDLLALGVFSGVTVRTADAADANGELPLTFQLSERKRHAVKLTAEYATDLGASTGVAWSDRNLRGHAEQLNVTLNATNLGGSASDGVGYDARVELVEPDRQHAEQTYHYSVATLKQNLEAYDIQSATVGALVSRRLSAWWTASTGISLERARITQQIVTLDNNMYTQTAVTTNYTLIALPLIGQYDTTRLTNVIADPTRGWRATLRLTPTLSLQSPRTAFVVVQTNLATYLSLSRKEPERRVLALRALAGNAFGAGQYSLPPDQRFYAGGSATVRGYKYQSIGPQSLGLDAKGNPIPVPSGGTTIAALGAELRQRIGTNFGAAAFIDTGQVTTSKNPFEGTWNVGVGAGVRYYTAIGPIRLDVGVPVNQPTIEGANRIQLYLGLGQAF